MNKLYLVAFGCWLVTAPSHAENLDRRTAIANAMSNMMDAFGFFGNQTIPKMPMSGNNSMPWNWQPNLNTRLDGTWIGSNGERWHIQGTNFYLQAADGRQISGMLRIGERMLALYQPQFNRYMLYEYVIQENRLALRDRYGNVLLYGLSFPPLR
jgi:hypothetical protein